MSLEEKIRGMEQDIGQTQRVVNLSECLRAKLMKSEPAPAQLEQAGNFLRSAQDLLKHGEESAAHQLLEQAERTLEVVRQWLAVGDLGISPYFLRTFLERQPPDRDLQAALIRYFLFKQPHAENDRDKLDYLLAAWFDAGAGKAEERETRPDELRGMVDEFFVGRGRKELDAAAEVMLHELESMIARVRDFDEFDQLVKARMVERVRALKTSLGESFYHPHVLLTVIRFNLAFRRHFENLFHAQLALARREARQRLDDAWSLVQAIETACEALALRASESADAGASAAEADEEAEPERGESQAVVDERLPIDNLARRGEESQKENEWRGITGRIARFVEKLPASQAKEETLVLPLRYSELKLSRWEREAFRPMGATAAPESTRVIQQTLGLMAWIEEELAQYKQTRSDRYQWKTHFDHLGYALGRAVDVLVSMRGLFREGASKAEGAWFEPLLHTALRLGTTLNRVAPVFEEPEAA